VLTEKQLIERIRLRFGKLSTGVGIGDDAAVVDLPPGSSTVLCADMLVEGTHFQRSTHPAESLGFKAVAVNVSDVGAMGAVPAFALLSLAVPTDLDAEWTEAFFDGIAKACQAFDIHLVGGDSSMAERIFIDVSVIGHVQAGHAVSRGGARPGDGIFVTGSLGGSAQGLTLLEQGTPVDNETVRRHLYPVPRHRIGQALAPQVTAMIDVSDGFSVDLTHILEASGVSARIDPLRIPCHHGVDIDLALELALHGGEDYELIVTGTSIPDHFEDIPITSIGQITESSGPPHILLVRDSGEEVLTPRGWQHFA
jgi:thiamine-monophosphate kinase